jgi:hypothetical protein
MVYRDLCYVFFHGREVLVASHRRLGEILLSRSLISTVQLEQALAEQVQTRQFLGEILLSHGWVCEEALMEAFAEQFSLPWRKLKPESLDFKTDLRYTMAVILDSHVLPLEESDTAVTAGISNPLDALAISQMAEVVYPKHLTLVLVCRRELNAAIALCQKKTQKNLKQLLD